MIDAHYVCLCFQDESEDSMAHMWRRVALCSTNLLEQLQAYQKAIDVLVVMFNIFIKIDDFSVYCTQ